MEPTVVLEQAKAEGWTDEEIAVRVLAGETGLYEIIMRRYNQRLYRVARAILRNDAEAEDVMQDAYVRAYEHLAQFAGRSRFAAWLTKIAVHEALGRLRKRGHLEELEAMAPNEAENILVSVSDSPEQQASNAEVGHLLETAILSLPEGYRTVLMMRDIEEMNTAETATALELTEENVKIRLHRARAMLRKELFLRAGEGYTRAFSFMGTRCDRVVRNVFQRILPATSGLESYFPARANPARVEE
jgi:RNA polymerase sigma-70 factor (ECF subfamily)